VILKTSEPTNQCGIFNFPTLSRMWRTLGVPCKGGKT
jgi:hypothetical protein